MLEPIDVMTPRITPGPPQLLLPDQLLAALPLPDGLGDWPCQECGRVFKEETNKNQTRKIGANQGRLEFSIDFSKKFGTEIPVINGDQMPLRLSETRHVLHIHKL